MKFRIALLILLTTLLSACNLTLAEDVTPPPGYIPPTPMPTLVLVPPQVPNVSNGEAIYFEKCAACHGITGLGDGAQGIQLGVTVPAFALPEVARPSSPSEWYTVVTRGRMDRFMPPFASLNDQERWDVVAYIMTLHTSEEEIQKGKEIFEANCPDCSTDYYENLNNMSALSTVELARIVRLGNDVIPAFGENLSDEEMWAVAEYLRSLTYSTTAPAQPTAVPPTATLAPAEAGTPSPDGTPQVEVTNEAQPVARDGFGSVTGLIDNKSGADFPSDMVVILRGYEHDFANPNSGTQEVLTLEGTVAADGSFVFNDVEIPENRIFLAEVTFQGIELTSDFAIVEAGQTSVSIPSLILYNITEDPSVLTVDELDIFLTADSEASYELFALYNFRNASDSILSVPMGASQEISFLKFPTGAEGLGYDAVQDSAPFISTADGIAIRPNEIPYGILSFASVARADEVTITQPLVLPVSVVQIFVPEGMEVEGDGIAKDRLQDVQGVSYQAYIATNLAANTDLTFKVSGSPKTASAGNEATTPNNTLLIGAGGLGLALLLAGGWMYLRDRNRVVDEDEEGEDDDEEDEDEFETSEDVMDALIALDDLYRAKKISDEAYQKRRTELKEILKEMM